MTLDDEDLGPKETELDEIIHLLAHGEIEVEGLVPWSSNYTFLVTVKDGEQESLAIYKPCYGERPLWDFDEGTLCRREVAAYLLGRLLGWPDIPPVVLRDGPNGPGSVQLFIDADLEEHYFSLRGAPEHNEAFGRIALYDHMANNADRKGGHVLLDTRGSIWAIDHGLTFHVDNKLRTVIWEYAGQPIGQDTVADLERVLDSLVDDRAELCAILLQLISADELAALRRRIGHLVRSRTFPRPRSSSRNVPYPLV